MTRPEPAFPTDGICANDGCEKPHAKLEAFCSNVCSREFFGNPIGAQSIWARDYGGLDGQDESEGP